jgi:hypothetical protein
MEVPYLRIGVAQASPGNSDLIGWDTEGPRAHRGRLARAPDHSFLFSTVTFRKARRLGFM